MGGRNDCCEAIEEGAGCGARVGKAAGKGNHHFELAEPYKHSDAVLYLGGFYMPLPGHGISAHEPLRNTAAGSSNVTKGKAAEAWVERGCVVGDAKENEYKNNRRATVGLLGTTFLHQDSCGDRGRRGTCDSRSGIAASSKARTSTTICEDESVATSRTMMKTPVWEAALTRIEDVGGSAAPNQEAAADAGMVEAAGLGVATHRSSSSSTSRRSYSNATASIGSNSQQRSIRGRGLKPGTCVPYFLGIVYAVDYLHARNVIHRDLKPENILVWESRGLAKIADFGWSTTTERDESLHKSFCGNLDYVAPEMLRSSGHGAAVYVWSLGVLLYELLSGSSPFQSRHQRGTCSKILSASIRWPSSIPADARDLIGKLLHLDPAERIPASRVVAHLFILKNQVANASTLGCPRCGFVARRQSTAAGQLKARSGSALEHSTTGDLTARVSVDHQIGSPGGQESEAARVMKKLAGADEAMQIVLLSKQD
ncbi:unnamed protein product [Amoebophrya sp. A25]|nr:unnamed protein product [Amoebophrya sp. A25]|eukprot:GSA25T00016242001.1